MGNVKDYSLINNLASIAAGDITAAFKPINTERLPKYCYCLKMTNDTTDPVIISYDGVNPHEYIRSGETISINSQTNNVPANRKSFIHGSYVAAIYVKWPQWVKLPGPVGTVYLMAYYLAS